MGAVLDRYEVNGYSDSDFYAVVWDEELHRVTSREYGTTRSWTYHNGAVVDATPEVIEKALAWYRHQWATLMIERAHREARSPVVAGRQVRSLAKRGKAHGVTGVVGWVGDNKYASRWTTGDALKRVRVDPDDGGERVFVSGDRVEVVEPAPVDEAAIRLRATTVTPSTWQGAYRGLFYAAIRD